MEISLKLILYQAINFIVLMALLGFLFNKFIRPFMHKRADDIKKAFEDIDGQKKEIEALKRQYAQQIKDVNRQAALELEKAVEEGKRLREEMKARSMKEGAELIEKAKKEIEQEKQKAITQLQKQLQKEVASLSLLAAKKLIGKKMDQEADRRLVEDFLTGLADNPPEK
jgi:F-type H+-transporting ATPase subunit b